MKKILVSFLSFMLVLGVCLGISQMVEQNKVKAESVASQNFEMQDGASFRSYWSTPNCGITYMATMPNGNSNISKVKLFVAPYDYVESIRGSSTEAIDYVTEFTQAKKQFLDIEPTRVADSTKTYFTGGVKNISAGQESRKWFGIYYYNDGSKNIYAQMPNGEMGQARSIAYLSSGYYNSGECTSENDKYMTSFYMDRAIKTAVSKESGKNGNPIVDTSTINYLYNAERTASVDSGQINATFLDDYITNKTTSIKVGNEIVNVGQRLDFKMDYSPFSQVINQNGKTGQFVNVLKAGEETQSVKLGLDTASIKVNIGQIDLTNAELTSQNKNFTDILVANGTTLKDRYNNTDITPSISLTVPKANNMLSDKVFDNSNISSIGSLVFTTSSDGANGNLTNANTDIKPTIYTTITGGNVKSAKQVTTTATKNKFNVSLNTSADNTVATAYKSKIPTSANQNYYYGQTYSYNTSMYGHSAYENSTKYNSSTFAGTVGADNISKSLVYKPNEYNVTIDYSTKYDIDKPPSQSKTVKFGYDVSIAPIEVIGYTKPSTYTKTITEEGDINTTQTYSINSYDVTINYKYGKTHETNPVALQTYSKKIEYRSSWSNNTNEVTGYNYDKASVSGTMTSATAETYTVTYMPKQYTRTITYKYSSTNYENKANSVIKTQTDTLEYAESVGASYPNTPTGYTPSPASISDKMGDENYNNTVNYNPISYSLSVSCSYTACYEDTAKVNVANYNVNSTIAYKQSYTFTPTAVAGYSNSGAVSVDWSSVGNKDLSVTYSPIDCKLTVSYTTEVSGYEPSAKSKTVKYGQTASIDSPTNVEGHTANVATYSKRMWSATDSATVNYSAISYKLTVNHEYGTVYMSGLKTGQTASNATEHSYKFKQNYSVGAATVTGHTPHTSTITGTMGSSNGSVTFTYNATEYSVKVTYTGASSGMNSNVNTTKYYGQTYNYTTNRVPMYTKNKDVVAGTVTGNVDVTVTYSAIGLNNAQFRTARANGHMPAANFSYGCWGNYAGTGGYYNTYQDMHYVLSCGNYNGAVPYVVNSGRFYFECEIAVDSTNVSSEGDPKIGILFCDQNGLHGGGRSVWCYLDLTGNNGKVTSDNSCGIAYIDGFNWTSNQTANTGGSSASTAAQLNTTTGWVRLGVFKHGSTIVFYVNDREVIRRTDATTLDRYLAIKAYNLNYNLQNARYFLYDMGKGYYDTLTNATGTYDILGDEIYVTSNGTEYALESNQFYFESTITNLELLNNEAYSKMGIFVKASRGDGVFFCAYTGENEWIEETKSWKKPPALEELNWAGYAYMNPTHGWYFDQGENYGQSKRVSTSTIGGKKYAVLQYGGKTTFFINNVQIYSLATSKIGGSNTTFGSENCVVAIKSFNIKYTVTNSKLTTDTTKLANLAASFGV